MALKLEQLYFSEMSADSIAQSLQKTKHKYWSPTKTLLNVLLRWRGASRAVTSVFCWLRNVKLDKISQILQNLFIKWPTYKFSELADKDNLAAICYKIPPKSKRQNPSKESPEDVV